MPCPVLRSAALPVNAPALLCPVLRSAPSLPVLTSAHMLLPDCLHLRAPRVLPRPLEDVHCQR
eukprot:1054570-Rhodomonas_salina.2